MVKRYFLVSILYPSPVYHNINLANHKHRMLSFLVHFAQDSPDGILNEFIENYKLNDVKDSDIALSNRRRIDKINPLVCERKRVNYEHTKEVDACIS